MKPLFLTLLFIGIFSLGYGQIFENKGPENMPFNKETKEFHYTETIIMDSISTRQIHKRAMRWFDVFYTNPKSVIKGQTDTTIIGKYHFNLFSETSGTKNTVGFCHYTITITCTNDAYTYDITRINEKANSYKGIEKWLEAKNKKEEKYNEMLFVQVSNHFKLLTDHLKECMNTPTNIALPKVSY